MHVSRSKTARPKAREAKRAARGETRGEREGQDARAGENGAQATAQEAPVGILLLPAEPADDAKAPAWCHEAPGYGATVGELLSLVTRFARLGQSTSDQSCIAAGRILDGLVACMDKPRAHREAIAAEMNTAATTLRNLGQIGDRFPARPNHLAKAQEELARVVANGIDAGADDERLARYVEAGRLCGSHLGTEKVLPHVGAAQERLARFQEAIEKLRSNTECGRRLDPEDVVAACARACGNRTKLFEGKRNREKRAARRE